MGQPRLAGRNCLIVGGTGGIGQACARRFEEEGARVAVVGLPEMATGGPSRTTDGTGETSEPVARANNPAMHEAPVHESGLSANIHQIFGDATDPANVSRFFHEALGCLNGRLDVLVHVAGISGRRFGDGPLHECTEAGWDHVLTANARSAFLTNREAVRLMLAQDVDSSGLRGSVVNIGSVLAESPSPVFFATVAYAASKGAVRSLTLASAARYAGDAIRFNLVEPGLIETPMAGRALSDPAILHYLATKQALTAAPGLASDVAEAVVYLSEPASRFVTGTISPVDGGWRLLDGQHTQRPNQQ